MKSSLDNGVKAREVQNLKIKIEQGNRWYLAEQFEQLDRAGTRVIIERRWELFGEILLDYLKVRASGGAAGELRYLDAGCGDGINLRWAADFFHTNRIDVKLTALDYNSVRVSRVAQKNLVRDACIASLLEMPFGDATFDILFCNHVIEHIGRYPLALSEILRVLKPGGLFMLGVPNEGCFLARLRNMVFQRSILKTTDHVNFFTSETLNNALCTAGFDIVKVCREGFFFPHFLVHYALTAFAWGGKLFEAMGRVFPGQSSGLIVYAVKPFQGPVTGSV